MGYRCADREHADAEGVRQLELGSRGWRDPCLINDGISSRQPGPIHRFEYAARFRSEVAFNTDSAAKRAVVGIVAVFRHSGGIRQIVAAEIGVHALCDPRDSPQSDGQETRVRTFTSI